MHEPAGTRPRLGVQMPPHAARQQKAPGAGTAIDSALDSPEYLGYGLPLIEKDRLGQTPQRHVWVITERSGHRLAIEAHHRPGEPLRARRLAGGSRPCY